LAKPASEEYLQATRREIFRPKRAGIKASVGLRHFETTIGERNLSREKTDENFLHKQKMPGKFSGHLMSQIEN
jgi:hypothetical protein